ncbi:MFS transporter [Pseudomethylobacillus aquaticus]|uniref:MFS transporter n=1 Tax=Pseudomethylobacillus aquaticus TaxID=2676064 RepID=A0A3N0UUN0_9PROT|nr:MFS transporter [Pseudomethylobacillus aquaticus]ROH84153.1 MFS transporter [Pseudomethylobacillus aquaticus]
MTSYLEIFRSRRVAVIFLLGFSSGLPLALTGGTLQAWMTVAGVDLATIGIFTLVGLPYTWKFLWSPLMDRFVPPLLGRRRGWIAATQLLLALGIAAMGAMDPVNMPWALAGLAVLVAFSSASQDVVFDAYRADVLRPAERGIGAAVSVLGYRLAMLVSGALALILSDLIGWQQTYWLMALLMLGAIAATLFGPEPETQITPPRTLAEAVVEPLREFFSRHGAWALLLLIVLYKLGDAFAGSLTTAFLIRGVEFTATEVGAINKGMGLIATLVGVVVGGTLMIRLGLFRSLLLFGILQAVSNLTFMWLAAVGKSYWIMALAVGIENLAGGMGTAAFVALLMALCNPRFTASQFALLSALAAVGRVYVGPVSGYLVESIGWVTFFGLTFLIALPGLLLLWRLRERLQALDHA